jgi:hypothetical protein
MDRAVGMGQAALPVAQSTRDLQAPASGMLVESLYFIGSGAENDTHVMAPETYAPFSGPTKPAPLPLPEEEKWAW